MLEPSIRVSSRIFLGLVQSMDYDRSDIPTVYDEARTLTPQRLRQWMDLLSAHIERETISLILDLGCGTGRFSEPLARRFQDASAAAGNQWPPALRPHGHSFGAFVEPGLIGRKVERLRSAVCSPVLEVVPGMRTGQINRFATAINEVVGIAGRGPERSCNGF